jgi:glycosyltransferase involved in cell wall biosynthesis
LRLVIDGRRLGTGRTGVGRYLECLLDEWAVTGPPLAEAVVVLKDPSALARIPTSPRLRAEVVGAALPGLVWENWALGRRLRPGDLLFAPTNLVPATWRGPTVLVLFDALQEARPVDFPWHVRWRFGARYRRAAARADRIIVPSRATARDVIHYYQVREERIQVIPPAIDPGFRPRSADAPECLAARRRLGLGEAPYFVFVGKRSRRRNVPTLLNAFARHRVGHPDHRLIFVGPGRAEAGLSGRDGVIVAGHVPEPILQGLIAGALALVYPSEHEGFGLPVLEALAGGCPAITLRRDALIEAGGEAPWYLDDVTPEGLAHAMHVLASDPRERAERVALGLAHAAGFRRGRFAQQVNKELNEVVSRGWACERRAVAGQSPPDRREGGGT